jgi:hypothetical protein
LTFACAKDLYEWFDAMPGTARRAVVLLSSDFDLPARFVAPSTLSRAIRVGTFSWSNPTCTLKSSIEVSTALFSSTAPFVKRLTAALPQSARLPSPQRAPDQPPGLD